MEGIRIDGDLSDWSAGLPRYPVAGPLLGSPRNAGDCSAEFRLGYGENENALYAAVAVQDADESEPSDGSSLFYSDDLVIIVVGIPSEGRDPLILGFLRSAAGGETMTVFGTRGKAYEANYTTQSCFQAEVRATAGQRSYEFRIDLTDMSEGRFRLRPHDKLELGLWVHDLDVVEHEPGREQSTLLTWVNVQREL